MKYIYVVAIVIIAILWSIFDRFNREDISYSISPENLQKNKDKRFETNVVFIFIMVTILVTTIFQWK